MNNATTRHYDSFSIVVHWLVAPLILVVFVSGVWMVDLDYYSPWFQLAPWWHKGLGFIGSSLILLRLVWHLRKPKPRPLPSLSSLEVSLSSLVHFIMDILSICLLISGYFIVTGQGQALVIFDYIQIPALLLNSQNVEDIAGRYHYYFAYVLMALVVGHVIMALKHHFVDRDETIMRMLGKK